MNSRRAADWTSAAIMLVVVWPAVALAELLRLARFPLVRCGKWPCR